MTATAERMWDLMSPERRVEILLKLGVPAHGLPGWCKGLTLTELARIGSEELPAELLGRLMLAMTPSGLLLNELRRCHQVLAEAILGQNSRAA
jgi:hypothetical protein